MTPRTITLSADMVLALYVRARRKHRGLTPAILARELEIGPDQVHAAEQRRALDGSALLRLLDWTGLRGTWVSGALCNAANARALKAAEPVSQGAGHE